MFSFIRSTVSEFVLLQGNGIGSIQPVFIHRHLLNSRALRHGKIFHTSLGDESTRGYWDSLNILTIKVDLDSPRH